MTRLGWLVVIGVFVLGSGGVSAAQEAGTIRSEFQTDAATRAMRNALTSTDTHPIFTGKTENR